MSHLTFPAWVYDLVGAVDENEVLCGHRPDDPGCLADRVAEVPETVLRDARTWRTAVKIYRQKGN